MPSHVLFDSVASRSVVSLVLGKKFRDVSGILDYPLEVEIVDDCSTSASSVHRGCVLNLFRNRYSTNLVLIPL